MLFFNTAQHYWRYCPTQDNPADLFNRGIPSSQQKSSTLWIHGSQWLPSENSWPVWQSSPNIEMQALAVTSTTFNPTTLQRSSGTIHIHHINISNYSTLSRLLGVTAYLCKFITNCKKQPQERLTGPLTPLELHHALVTWVKQCQEEMYSKGIASLTSPSSTTKRLPLVRQLHLFLDEDHMLHCDGRIHNAPLRLSFHFYSHPNTP